MERYHFQRDQEGKITDITGRCGGKLTFGYSQGKLAYVSDLSGSRVRFVSYDVQEKLTTIMDEEEYKTRYYYNENLNITRRDVLR